MCAISKSVFSIVYRPPDCTEQSFKSCLSFNNNYFDSVSDELELNIQFSQDPDQSHMVRGSQQYSAGKLTNLDQGVHTRAF